MKAPFHTGYGGGMAVDRDRRPAATTRAGKPDVVLEGPQALRALAHPVRLKAIDELFSSQEPRTATELADLCGTSPSAMSYHLRSLARWGVVSRAAASADTRERPWQAAGAKLRLSNTDNRVVEDEVVTALAFDATRDRYRAWSHQRRDTAPAGDTLANIARGDLALTFEEAAELDRQINELLEGRDEWHPPETDRQRMVYLWAFFPSP